MAVHLNGRSVEEVKEAARRQAREHEDCRDLIIDLLDHVEALERTLRYRFGPPD